MFSEDDIRQYDQQQRSVAVHVGFAALGLLSSPGGHRERLLYGEFTDSSFPHGWIRRIVYRDQYGNTTTDDSYGPTNPETHQLWVRSVATRCAAAAAASEREAATKSTTNGE